MYIQLICIFLSLNLVYINAYPAPEINLTNDTLPVFIGVEESIPNEEIPTELPQETNILDESNVANQASDVENPEVISVSQEPVTDYQELVTEIEFGVGTEYPLFTIDETGLQKDVTQFVESFSNINGSISEKLEADPILDDSVDVISDSVSDNDSDDSLLDDKNVSSVPTLDEEAVLSSDLPDKNILSAITIYGMEVKLYTQDIGQQINVCQELTEDAISLERCVLVEKNPLVTDEVQGHVEVRNKEIDGEEFVCQIFDSEIPDRPLQEFCISESSWEHNETPANESIDE